MNYNTITDEEVLEAVEGSLSAVSMRRPIEAITTRGRGLRRRRRALSGTAVAGALGLSLAVVLPLSDASSGQTLNANGHVVNVDMAGWSVHAASRSAVTVTLREVFSDPAGLQSVLKQAGIHAIVRSVGENDPDIGCSQRGVHTLSLVRQVVAVHSRDHVAGDQIIDIDPSAMPDGSVLEIVVYYAEARVFTGGVTDRLQTSVVTLLDGDPGKCVPAPPVEKVTPQPAVSERK